MMQTARNLVAILLIASLTTACVSTTQIQSQPSGAEVIMDGTIKLGKTPVEMREMVWVWTNRQFQASLPGHQTATFQIEKSYPWGQNLAVCLCTGLIMWPVVFASRYVPNTLVVLQPKSQGRSDEGVVEQPALAFDSSL